MSSSEPPSLRSSGLRVLLVEDEIMVALLLEEMLAELGHEVVGPVARLKQALEMAQQERLDVAILDVNISGDEVYPVAEALAARDEGKSKVILFGLSGHGHFDLASYESFFAGKLQDYAYPGGERQPARAGA